MQLKSTPSSSKSSTSKSAAKSDTAKPAKAATTPATKTTTAPAGKTATPGPTPGPKKPPVVNKRVTSTDSDAKPGDKPADGKTPAKPAKKKSDFKGTMMKSLDSLKNLGSKALDAAKALGEKLMDGVETIGNILKNLFDKVKDFINIPILSEKIEDVMKFIGCLKEYKANIRGIVDILESFKAKIKIIFSGDADGIATIIVNLICNYKEFGVVVNLLISGIKASGVERWAFFGNFLGKLMKVLATS